MNRSVVLIVALASAACGKESSSGSAKPIEQGANAAATRSAGGPCKDLAPARCLDAVFDMYEADKDAANMLANHLCDSELGEVTRQACTISGHIYREGAPQTPKDLPKALARYQRGCPLDAGDAEAGSCFRVGIALGKGTLTLGQPATLPIDTAKAKPYLDLACTKKFEEACQIAASL